MSGFDQDLLSRFSGACEKLRIGGTGASSLHVDVAELLRKPGIWMLCLCVIEEGAGDHT